MESCRCGCKNTKYFAGIIDDSVVMRDQVIDVEETKIVITNLMKKMLSVKGKISVFYLPIYATMASLMAFSIYCYLIIDKSKRKHSLSFRITNNTFKIFCTGSNN